MELLERYIFAESSIPVVELRYVTRNRMSQYRDVSDVRPPIFKIAAWLQAVPGDALQKRIDTSENTHIVCCQVTFAVPDDRPNVHVSRGKILA